MMQETPDDNSSTLNLVNIGYDQRYLHGNHKEEIIALAKLPIHDGHVHTMIAYHDPEDDCEKLDRILRSIDRQHCVTFYPDGHRLQLSPNSYLLRASDLDVYTCAVVNHALPPVWVNNMNAIAFSIRDPGANETCYDIPLEQAYLLSSMCAKLKIGQPDENATAVEKMIFEAYTAASLVHMQKSTRDFSSREVSSLHINKDLLKFISREIGIIFIILVADYIIEGK